MHQTLIENELKRAQESLEAAQTLLDEERRVITMCMKFLNLIVPKKGSVMPSDLLK